MSTNTPSVPSQSVQSWKIEFDARIKAFAEASKVSETQVRKTLLDLGADGDSEQSLNIIDSDEILPMGDLRAAFVDSGHTKIALLRLAIPHLRGKTYLAQPDTSSNNVSDIASALKDMVAANRPKSDLSPYELIERYDESETEIIKILREKSHGRHFVVFNSDGQVNKEVTFDLLKVAIKQNTTDRHMVVGRMVRVYRAGEFLTTLVDESPFFRGVPLVNGVCGKSATDWTMISLRVRTLARIQAIDIEGGRLSNSLLRQIWTDALAANESKSAGRFLDKYPEASLKYDELLAKDELPKLKIDPRSSGSVTKTDTGF